MSKEVTNVYVPVKTPDHKKWALLLALLIHSGILGFIIYTNHTKNLDEPVMETTLVTPEQLSAIQGQIAANQNNHAQNTGDSLTPDGKTANAPAMTEFLAGGSHSNMPAPQPSPSPQAQAIAEDLARQQAAFEKERDALAAQLDKEAATELQNVAKRIDQQQIENNQIVKEFKITESHSDEETEALRQEAEKAAKAQEATRKAMEAQKNANNQSFGIKADPNADTGDAASYRNTVQSIINRNWHPPTNAKEGTLQTAYFDISSSGSISNVRVDGSDSPLKSSLIQAIQNSSLPPPPPELVSRFASNRMVFVVR